MGLVFLVISGALLGWVAAIVMRAESGRGLMLNVALGICGTLFAGLVVHPMIGRDSLLEGRYSVAGLLVAVIGAMAVLLVVNVLRIREMR